MGVREELEGRRCGVKGSVWSVLGGGPSSPPANHLRRWRVCSLAAPCAQAGAISAFLTGSPGHSTVGCSVPKRAALGRLLLAASRPRATLGTQRRRRGFRLPTVVITIQIMLGENTPLG